MSLELEVLMQQASAGFLTMTNLDDEEYEPN